MTHLTRLSLANRLIVGLLTLAIIVFGVLAIFSLKQELLPSTQVPAAVVTASYPGTSPQIVADEVSTPIGQAVLGVNGVTKVQSTSSNGVASISVEWQYGLDFDEVVREGTAAVDSLSTLPDQVETSVLSGSTDDIPVLQLAVASDASFAEAGRLVENVAVPDLSEVEGVRSVTLTGQNTSELAVSLRPEDLRRYDLTAQAVTETIRSQALVTPAGTSYDGRTELAVEVGRNLDSVKRVRNLWLPATDGPVALSKVADVELQAVESTSVARADGRPALSLTILKETDADAVEISHAIEDRIPDLQRQLGSNTTFSTVFDQAPLIEQSIHDLAVEGGLGLSFAVLVILVFLLSLRSTVITAISIPMSLLIAMIGLQLGDFSLNIFTLAALTVAVGRVVDDSIVVIENIKRRDTGAQPLTPADIIASVREVAGAVTASTLTTVAVFLPVAFVSGVVGELFRPFAVTVAVALGASLLVSMTIVPVLAFWFLRGRRRSPAARVADQTHDQVTRLQRGYLPVLRWGLRHPLVTLLAALIVFGGTMGSATLLKTDFLGSVSDETALQIDQELPAGSRLSVTSDAAEKVEEVLAGTPQVETYLTTIGGGGNGFDGGSSSTNTVAITVKLHEGEDGASVQDDLQRRLGGLKGAGTVTVSRQNNGGTNSDVTVTVTGEDARDLRTGAQQVEALLTGIPGLTDVRSDLAEQRKVLQVDVDQRKAAAQGFTQAEVGQAVVSSLRGTQVGSVTLEGEQRDITVRVQASEARPSDIANLELPVSQLQQQQAQTKAADKLADKQEASNDEAQREADQAAEEQQQELRDQRAEAEDSLADLREQLRVLRASPPPAPDPSAPPVPVSQQQLAAQQYGEQVGQLDAAVQQAEDGIEQLDEQLDGAAEQATKTAEQRSEAEDLQDEQQALEDVRATPVKVRDVADVATRSAPTTVTQIDGTPSVTITATPDTTDLGALTTTIQQRLDALTDLPAGVSAAVGGASSDQQDAFNQLGLAMLLAILLVFIIMVATFRSLVQPLILLVSVPFAATGAVAGLLLTDTALGVPAMVGLLMLIGIVVTNAIVLIDLINQYRAAGEDLPTAVMDGARLRLRPIIMTACATIFALIPMGLGLTGGGAFISRPLAIVVIGGLVSSTVLTLLLVPVLYTLVERRGERRRQRTADRGATEPAPASA